jgi:hypothetical protein
MMLGEFPLFSRIEIETHNTCNASCSFCQVNASIDDRVHVKMPDSLFRHIIVQLADLDYRGQILLCSNNEPLLDDRIYGVCRYAKEKVPGATLIIYTNGLLPRFRMIVFRFGLIVGVRPFLAIRLQFRCNRYTESRHVSSKPLGMSLRNLLRMGEWWRVARVNMLLETSKLKSIGWMPKYDSEQSIRLTSRSLP